MRIGYHLPADSVTLLAFLDEAACPGKFLLELDTEQLPALNVPVAALPIHTAMVSSDSTKIL